MGIALAVAGFGVGVVVGRGWRAAAHRRSEPLDALTGIPTRAGVDRALRELRTGDAVVVLDVDELKATNDTAGHGAGDAALVALARHLSAGVRGGDIVARFGGDEFVIVLRNGAAAAANVVDRLRASSPVSFSAGVAAFRVDGSATFGAADAALLAAKRAGGRRVVSA